MEPTLEALTSQFIIVGNFNPPIFTPDWLNKNGLIGDDDNEEAKAHESLIVSPAIARFETEWFSLQVVQTQFVLASKGPVTPLLLDLLIGIFSLIDQTPVSAFGLNFSADYKMPSTEAWHKVGDTLAPKDIWYRFYPQSSQSVGLSELSIEIDPFKRGEENSTGRKKRLSISYSKHISNGVYFFVNNHYPVTPEQKSKNTSAGFAVKFISTHWEDEMNEAQKVFAGILTEITRKES